MAVSPSNLALIKYMGKVQRLCNQKKNKSSNESLKIDQIQSSPETTFSNYLHIPVDFASHLSKKEEELFWFKNQAINPSLSYTLKHFVTAVQIEPAGYKDSWKAFKEDPFKNKKLYHSSKKQSVDSELSQSEQKKFLDFFKFLKNFFLIPGYYTISSKNNFLRSIGSASSASSFSALTLAVYKLAKEKTNLEKNKFRRIKSNELAHLSRVGSGSSCRSFCEPWCIWDAYKVYTFKNSWDYLLHQLVIVDNQGKKVSSTTAHQNIETSPQFSGRGKRANKRLVALQTSFNLGDWKSCFKICYEEFLDMHFLFESSKPSFSYKTEETQKVLECINQYWKKNKDGPLVTMDAGPNVHLLYRPDQKACREDISKKLSDFTILSSL